MFLSAKKIQANRDNARKSTGPRSDAGKAVVAQNGTVHGAYCGKPLLPGEDETAYEELKQSHIDDLQPSGKVQNLIVERIVAAAWKIRRLQDVEAEMTARHQAYDPYWIKQNQWSKPPTTTEVVAHDFEQPHPSFARITDLQMKLDRLILSQIRELRRMKKDDARECEEVGTADERRCTRISEEKKYMKKVERRKKEPSLSSSVIDQSNLRSSAFICGSNSFPAVKKPTDQTQSQNRQPAAVSDSGESRYNKGL